MDINIYYCFRNLLVAAEAAYAPVAPPQQVPQGAAPQILAALAAGPPGVGHQPPHICVMG